MQARNYLLLRQEINFNKRSFKLTYIFDDRYSSIIFVRCAPQHPMTEMTYCFVLMHD